MHDTIVVMKDGTKISSPIYMWRPQEGWFSLFDHIDKIWLRDVKSAVTENQRINIKTIGDQDELERAREDGWSGD